MVLEKDTPWHIREARKDEADQIKAVVVEAYSVYIDRIGKPPGPMLDDYSDLAQRYPVFVAELDGGIAGILVMMPGPDDILMDNVAVLPNQQGRGIGLTLITFAENYARDHGYRSLDLYTNDLMHENIRLYKSLNYVETRRVLEKGYNRVYMRKGL